MTDAAWTKVPERGAVSAMRSLVFTLNLLGYGVARALLIPIAAYFVLSGARSRRASRDYLKRLHQFDGTTPKPTLIRIYLHHLEFAQTLLERVLLWQGKTDQFQFSGSGRELLEGMGETGCLLVGAHFGSFDVLRVLAKDLTKRVNVVMYRAHALRINRFLEEINPDANLRVVELSPGDTKGILTLKECIERGEHVAILADRLAPGSRQRISKVKFLGSDARFPENPWLIASIFNCPVIFVTAVRMGSRSYHISVERFAETIPRQPDILKNHIQEFAGRLETLCLRHPMQWFNFYDFWGVDEKDEKGLGVVSGEGCERDAAVSRGAPASAGE